MQERVPTNRRFSNLEARDVERPTAGFLLVGASTTFTCPDCGARRIFGETELTRPVFEPEAGAEGVLEFGCDGCSYRGQVEVNVTELPSWSCELRVVMGAEVVEFCE